MRTSIRLDDDWRFHHGSDDPFWNESSFFSFAVPDRLMNGFVYFWFRPNMGFACGGPAVWDPSGEHTWDCLFYDWDWPQEIPPDAEFYDFELANGLSITTLKPMDEYLIGYDNDGCRLDLRWQRVTDHHEIMIGDGLAQAGHRHYEQFGRMTGTVVVDSQRFNVDCYSMRDRSWGPRRMRASPRGDYLWAVASPHHAFHCIAVGQPGDPHERVAGGFYLKDGEMADLVSGHRRVVERSGARPAVIRLEAKDSQGRHLEAEGRPVNWFEWQGYGHQFEWWCLAQWEFDGQRCWGEEQEFHPLRGTRGHILTHQSTPGGSHSHATQDRETV